MSDVDERVREAARKALARYWDTKSVELSLAELTPYLLINNVAAMHTAASILASAERYDEAREFCNEMLQNAKSDKDYVEIMLACETGVFDILPGGRDGVYQKAMIELANRGNWVIQTELALNYKNGKRGFARNEGFFLKWIEAAAGSGGFDPVAHYVEYLIQKKKPVPQSILSIIDEELRDHPMHGKLMRLLEKSKSKGN